MLTSDELYGLKRSWLSDRPIEGPASISGGLLREVSVRPIPSSIAKTVIEQGHYLHSMPGGTKLTFGVFKESRLLGAIAFGVGPMNAFALVAGAESGECVTLTRLWVSDVLPKNTESFILGVMVRALKKHTELRFIVTYADPAAGHVGTIYQATNWVYTGLSDASSLYDVGDGETHHSRSLSNWYGTHSVAHFRRHGVPVRVIPQVPKHRYIYFLDPTWRSRLRVPVLPFPKKGAANGSG